MISLSLYFLSCEKDRNENSYCIKSIKRSPEMTILSKSEMDEIKRLFICNQLFII